MKAKALAYAAIVVTLAGCAWLRPAVKSALDALDIACVLATRSEMPEEAAAVCNIAEDLLPFVRDVIAARKASHLGVCR